jgi:type VI protein secretion system component Hcp
MATGDATDLIMKFVYNRNPIAGECLTNVLRPGRPTNELAKGFSPGWQFEIDRFSLKAGLSEASTPDAAAPGAKGTAATKGHATAKPALIHSKSADKGASHTGFRPGKTYPVDIQPVSFTRSIDASSTTLIQKCIDCETFDSATLIKRKAAGSDAAGEVFLRLDFFDVLIIAVDWSNDEEVQETCQFICRSIVISYRPQLPDGTLAGRVSKFWSNVKGATEPPLS